MLKNSSFIQKKEFHVVFKGYKPEEVDKFLDSIALEIDRLIAKNNELQENLDKLKFDSSQEETTASKQDEDFKKIIQDALVSAHKVAEDIREKAKKEAEALIEKTKAEEDEKITEIREKKKNMEEELGLVSKEYDEVKTKLKSVLEKFNLLVSEMDGMGFKKHEVEQETVSPGKDLSKEDVDLPAEQEEPLNTFGDNVQEEVTLKKEPEVKKTAELDPDELMSEEMIEDAKEKALEEEKVDPPDIDDKSTMDEKEEFPKKDKQTGQDKDEKDRKSKKMDIADPDLIESFFKSEEEKNY